MKCVKILGDGKVIIQGDMKNNIKNTDQSYEWFIKELKKKGYSSYDDILLATYSNNNITVYRKNEGVKRKDVFE